MPHHTGLCSSAISTARCAPVPSTGWKTARRVYPGLVHFKNVAGDLHFSHETPFRDFGHVGGSVSHDFPWPDSSRPADGRGRHSHPTSEPAVPQPRGQHGTKLDIQHDRNQGRSPTPSAISTARIRYGPDFLSAGRRDHPTRRDPPFMAGRRAPFTAVAPSAPRGRGPIPMSPTTLTATVDGPGQASYIFLISSIGRYGKRYTNSAGVFPGRSS